MAQGATRHPPRRAPRTHPRLSVRDLKHAALRPSTHRTYAHKVQWWLRFLAARGAVDADVSGTMLEEYVQFLFEETAIAPGNYE